MDRPSKIFLGGIICAAFIAAIGFVNTYRLEYKLKQLEADCIKQGVHKESKLDFQMICDAKDLSWRSDTNALVGIQASIVATQREVWKYGGWPYLIAAAVLVVSGIPWGWYFLLHRIRELRDAIVGK